MAQLIKTLGTSWESVSTPFMCFEGEQAIAHVGVLEIPVWMMGKPMIIGGIHGVATHPDYRRRGYYRQCMTAALDYCATRYQTLALTTDQPDYYTPFGFRAIQEHAFVAECQSTGDHNGFRILDLKIDTDRAILHRLLDERTSVSDSLGSIGAKALFFFNEVNNPLYYAEDLDLIIAMEIENTQLKLHDIVWKQPCQLIDILDRIPQPIHKAVFYFSPDRLNIDAQAVPQLQGGDSYLMVHGEFAAEGRSFMLPRSARC
ncbi:MAG: GNAT family N-acetyltransferase [Cyanobacteria bacterium RU_5_0]|nr:GNAT family N-acetyltransferase [Cyanobacteria bacterium RU_5_0]